MPEPDCLLHLARKLGTIGKRSGGDSVSGAGVLLSGAQGHWSSVANAGHLPG